MGIWISQTTPLKIRYVKVMLDTGEVEVLATNLYDSSLYTIADLKKFILCAGESKRSMDMSRKNSS